MPFVLAIGGVLGAIAFRRRKQIGDDAHRINDAARNRVRSYRSQKKKLLTELGEHYYASSTNGDDVEQQAEMARIVDRLIQIDAESAENDNVISDDAAKAE